MKAFFNTSKSFYKLLILSTLFYGLTVVSLNYSHFPASGFVDYFAIVGHWFLVTLASGVLIYFLLLNRWIFAVLFPLFILVTGIIAYYIFQYDITINTAVIQSTFNTNNDEVLSQISLRQFIYILVLTIIAIFFVYKRIKLGKLKFVWIHILVVIAGLFIISTVNTYRYNTIYQRNPFSIYLGLKKYQNDKLEMAKIRKDISKGAFCNTDSITVVVVIGEAMRADHVSLNGYKRETFPEMKKANPVSYRNIYSEWTHTFQSLPHILTRADSINHAPSSEEQSFISIFKTCKYRTWWIGNQELSYIALTFARECDTFVINEPYKSDYSFTGKYDGELLPYIKHALQNNSSRKLIVIQQVGCHWWYPSYYPTTFEKFKPVLKSKSFNNSDKEKIINAYDNAALYTDYFLSEVVKMIKSENSIMIYLSDHGELLGEEGKWMHAQETEYEKNPACMVWFSDRYSKRFPEKVIKAIHNKDKRFRTDFLFHTALDAGEVQSPYRVDKLSILK
jgi:glucan phosphoethanolaminetransferase (alkaline phosphatase superfamily)